MDVPLLRLNRISLALVRRCDVPEVHSDGEGM